MCGYKFCTSIDYLRILIIPKYVGVFIGNSNTVFSVLIDVIDVLKDAVNRICSIPLSTFSYSAVHVVNTCILENNLHIRRSLYFYVYFLFYHSTFSILCATNWTLIKVVLLIISPVWRRLSSARSCLRDSDAWASLCRKSWTPPWLAQLCVQGLSAGIQ